MCGNVLCWRRNRPRGPCNEIRVIEFILCVVCFTIAMFFVTTGRMPLGVFLTLFCITMFIFITLVDIIVITAWFPIGWRAWILISLTAALFFFTCGGLSILVGHSFFFVGTILYIITAIVFLLDALCIIWLVQGVEDISGGGRPCPSSVCKASQIIPLNRPSSQKDIPPNASCSHQSQQTQYTASSRSEPKCHRWQPPKTTYGGTFHVSKDTAPLPTPKSISKTMSEFEEHDTYHVEADPPRKFRTVAVMTRMVPKKKHCEVDLTPLKSPFDNPSKRPIKKCRRVSFTAYREREEGQFRYDTTNSNSLRSFVDSDKSSPRSNQQTLSKSKV